MDIVTNLSVLFVKYYNDLKIKEKTFIPDTKVALSVMLELYSRFVSEKILIPIEDLTVEEKIELTSECRQMEDIVFTNKTLTEHCKILYVIKTINNNS